MSEKERIVKAMQDLPETATIQDAMERLRFLQTLLERIEEADREPGIPHEEIEKEFLG